MRCLVIDCETTGLSPINNQVLTVGMLVVEVKSDFLEVIDSEHVFIRHERYKISGIALKINGINLDEHHETGIKCSKACGRINRFIRKHFSDRVFILGHNLKFDLNFLNNLYERQGRQFDFMFEKVDTMQIWRGLKKKGIVPESSASLKTLAKYFGVDYEGAHDALNDCHITANVFFNLMRFLKNYSYNSEIDSP